VQIGFGLICMTGLPLVLVIGAVELKVGALLVFPILFAAAAGGGFGHRQYQLGRRRWLAETASTEVPQGDFILFLRGFRDDILAAEAIGLQRDWTEALLALIRIPLTEEEHLARALGTFYPVVAIGQPGEQWPLLGARRIYLDDAEWQHGVHDLMHRARFVVLRLGSEDGLLWEFRTALRDLSPDKLACLLTVQSSFNSDGRRILLSYLSEIIEEELGCPPPDIPEPRRPSPRLGTLRALMCFSEERRPFVLPLDIVIRGRVARHPLASVLSDVFDPLLRRVPGTAPSRSLVGRRALAAMIDMALFQILSIPITFATLPTTLEDAQNYELHSQLWRYAGILFVYAFFMEISPWHGTIGKRLSGLQVVPEAKEWAPPRILLRNVLKWGAFSISWWVPWFFLITIALRGRRALHEILSGTRVVASINDKRVTDHLDEALSIEGGVAATTNWS